VNVSNVPRRTHVFAFEGITPVIDPSAYIHPQATIIGDVWIGAGCYVAAGAVMRGDFGRIEMRAGSNLQDNCVVHSLPDFDCLLDVDSHIGHGAVIHGCSIGVNVLVGMNAVVMDYATVEQDSVVAAMSFVKVRGHVPPRTLVAGVPARVVRELSDADIAGKRQGTSMYHELTVRCRQSLIAAEPLDSADPQRQRIRWRIDHDWRVGTKS
jgi:phenylacetic acid degradation protein